jgi:hypothetical protein
MEMQQIIEMLAKMKANRKADQAKADADREELKGMMNATQERMDANLKEM